MTNDFMDIKKALKDRYEGQVLKILVCGKTGIGKSSLLNTLIGQELFEIGGPGVIDEFTSSTVTQHVTPAYASMQNVLLEIFDSPGLQDDTGNDEQYLADMHKKCENVNLVLYCIDMSITRWTNQDLMATRLLTEKFGVEFWKKAVLVLTKANTVKPGSPDVDDKIFCKRAYNNFMRMFQEQLIKQEVPKDIVIGIPTVAAGSYSDRCLPYVSKAVSNNSEQNYQDFLPELWLTCFEQILHNPRYSFIRVRDYSKRIEVSKDCLSQKQKEFIEQYEQQCDAKHQERQEKSERKYNEKKIELQSEKEREIRRIHQNHTRIRRSDSYLQWYP